MYEGGRSALRSLFESAEDSPTQLASYIDLGVVLVAWAGSGIAGHVQLVEGDDHDVVEIKNMAVADAFQRRGIGSSLLSAAIDHARSGDHRRMTVATATADTDNLRFYQRAGFRLLRIERDAFTPDTGYPDRILIDGIELRDRVWLEQDLLP